KLATPGNCVLAIYGDVKAEAVKAAVEKSFGGWKMEGGGWTKPNSELRTPNSELRASEVCDKKQAVLVIGFAGTTMFDTDRYALELLQEACSDLGSRLFLRIREKLGLAYYVGAQHMPGLAPGYFAFYAGTEPEKVKLVEAEMLNEARLLCAEGLSAEELSRAKAKIIGQKKIARQELGGLAMATALDELYGLGHGYSDTEDAKYEAVTPAEITAAARKYLSPERAVIAVVGPGK
ncbi:MAG: insulinase family protein, partial [Verrucomicrobia bacterium]|nr:insulinase family protein [Verrucomicrobiota bacterium]